MTRESTMRKKEKCQDSEDKDKISGLPDELLLKILLLLPTKTAVRTSILSKRWEFLWMWLPKLEYDCSDYSPDEQERFNRFINLNLPLHKAPVIESLRLKFNGPVQTFEPQAIELWVAFAVSHCIRELSLAFRVIHSDYVMRHPARLPSSLYICKSLVILNLNDDVLIDVPRMACLPFLKTLFLRRVTYSYENSLTKLLSSCPVLEDLVLERSEFDYLGTWKVIVPSLQRLTIEILRTNDFRELVVRTPSLKYFKIIDDGASEDDNYSFDSNTMPNLEEVYIDSVNLGLDKFVSSITYVKRLTLCIRVDTQEALYRAGIAFNHLKHLKLCQCDSNWSKLLARLLNDSPNLQELEIYQHADHEMSLFNPWVSWENELNCVPKCLLSTLETFKWTKMIATEKASHLLKYIFKYASRLKTATVVLENAPEATVQETAITFSSTACQFVCEFE
ncbi:PREDICTED: putative F-box/LRR-repeat protein At4g15060 [Camelina sativa]|uniref:F-box/LRR-repeat protein At4g15060 n=1 Tax=Camelina sativa TaxID=90675 RepID=A0ABM1QNF0_CAMSA|nr:PREDICTED: putative F-box/LRR-repeat protein At4g15060 [Camelina sativa]